MTKNSAGRGSSTSPQHRPALPVVRVSSRYCPPDAGRGMQQPRARSTTAGGKGAEQQLEPDLSGVPRSAWRQETLGTRDCSGSAGQADPDLCILPEHVWTRATNGSAQAFTPRPVTAIRHSGHDTCQHTTRASLRKLRGGSTCELQSLPGGCAANSRSTDPPVPGAEGTSMRVTL